MRRALAASVIISSWSCQSFTARIKTPSTRFFAAPRASKLSDQDIDELVSDFCKGTNEFWASLVLPSVRENVKIVPSGTAGRDPLSILTAAPEVPGIPRSVWLVILFSAPSLLLWYGYYKFSVEEELFQWELRTHPKGYVSGCGGFGTLFPFVFGFLIGSPLAFLHIPPGDTILQLSSFWILFGQLNLYRRVNEILPEPALHEWSTTASSICPLSRARHFARRWVFLPPPLDVVVGLRQVHFLAEFWRAERGYEADRDVVAEKLFPFIARMPRFTLKEFFRTPSMWFWFTKDWPDFEFDFLKD